MNIYRDVTIKFKEKGCYHLDRRDHRRGSRRKREGGEGTDIIVFQLKAY